MPPGHVRSWYGARRSWALACLVAAGAGAYFFYSAPRPASPVRATVGQATSEREATPLEPAASATPDMPARAVAPHNLPVSAERVPDEPTLMSELRALLNTAPSEALALARRGDALFPDSPNAPERAWVVVKALDLLKRFHEAQAEAKVMLQLYPNTPWTEDVERHVLLYPLDQPSREEQQAAAAH